MALAIALFGVHTHA